jgi:hypothetical protein
LLLRLATQVRTAIPATGFPEHQLGRQFLR